MDYILKAVKNAIAKKICTANSVHISMCHYDYRRSQIIVQSSVNRLFIVSEHDAFNGSVIRGTLFSAFNAESDGLKEAIEHFDKLVARANSAQYREHYRDKSREYYDNCAYEAAHIFTQSLESGAPDFEEICDLIREADLEPIDVFDRFKYDGTGSSIVEVIEEMVDE